MRFPELFVWVGIVVVVGIVLAIAAIVVLCWGSAGVSSAGLGEGDDDGQ